MIITSKDNNLIKNINKLKHKKYRNEYNKYIIEGKKIVEEAISSSSEYIGSIIVSESYAKKNNIPKTSQIVSDDVFDYITDYVNAEGILAIMNKKEEKEINYNEEFILILDEIQDPGNLGTIMRMADSLNLDQIITSENIVDPYMSKVISSTKGSIFRVDIFRRNLIDEIDNLKKHGYKIYSAALDDMAKTIYNIDVNDKIAIILGNESSGVNDEILRNTEKVYIPMLGKTESLNVAVAASIISYEIYRKKGLLN